MRRALLVEGRTDLHVVGQLLNRAWGRVDFGFDLIDAQGVAGALDQLGVRVRAGGSEAIVGAVLDADDDPGGRWAGVRSRLVAAGYPSVPSKRPVDGLLVPANGPLGLARVGVWIMPDNLVPGMIEDFLCALVGNDPLMAHAEAVVDDLIERERNRFDPARRRGKAIVHSYLAWQVEPGLPCGLAVKSRVFDADHALARRFVGWVEALFGRPGPHPAH